MRYFLYGPSVTGLLAQVPSLNVRLLCLGCDLYDLFQQLAASLQLLQCFRGDVSHYAVCIYNVPRDKGFIVLNLHQKAHGFISGAFSCTSTS